MDDDSFVYTRTYIYIRQKPEFLFPPTFIMVEANGGGNWENTPSSTIPSGPTWPHQNIHMWISSTEELQKEITTLQISTEGFPFCLIFFPLIWSLKSSKLSSFSPHS